jgi:hypothetical protein
MTDREIHDLEAALRRARQEVFSPDPEVEARASAQITACKARLASVWEARQREQDRAASDAKMRLWE